MYVQHSAFIAARDGHILQNKRQGNKKKEKMHVDPNVLKADPNAQLDLVVLFPVVPKVQDVRSRVREAHAWHAPNAASRRLGEGRQGACV